VRKGSLATRPDSNTWFLKEMNENVKKNLDRRKELDRRLKEERKLERILTIQELTKPDLTKPELTKQELTKPDKLKPLKCDKTYLEPKLLGISNQEVLSESEQLS